MPIKCRDPYCPRHGKYATPDGPCTRALVWEIMGSLILGRIGIPLGPLGFPAPARVPRPRAGGRL